ncbi:MarR family winged helix-turn-helix transcriptional regulator [Actinoalloteichus hymeniacidonis]|uniref:Transcriptional regulator n=1 Tax=Actinoalloteichus hymeniacidonis TaxID=340345 RepID=A0AAC9HKB6_9PSEU|nr:MarR family winged helix-turn-helix transcriptional regulator [Actinoalloteichus hymeniacidonis]AOS61017.1 transcriptional regulator [Actinoalloteichus hymeniacidonis]MBB5910983.1 DNA-binding MarR family transcriptional regulator [Actinoalloteichus hymeniacidonis]
MATPAAADTPTPHPCEAALEADLGWGLGVVFRAHVKVTNAVLEDIPGGPRGHQVLAFAVQDLGGNQGTIAAQLGLDRTVLTYLIDDLEKAGLVERRPDPSDRRSRLVVATKKGRALWTDRQDALRHVERHVLSALGEDATLFRQLLQRVAVHANSFDPVKDTCSIVEELT